MPLVRISVLQGPEGFGRKVGQVVYRTMVDTIDVPRDDNFQVITEHPRDTLAELAKRSGASSKTAWSALTAASISKPN